MKKRMVLADLDSEYLNHIAGYFMEHAPQLEQNLFTKSEKLRTYLERGEAADILVISEDMLDAVPSNLGEKTTKILLSSTMEPKEGYAVVKKYQKTQNLLNDILLKYAEKSGSAEAIRGKSNTRMIAFYSPAGGSGKTALSLGLASSMAAEGKKVFYLNLEAIDSVSEILPHTSGSLSDLILAVRSKGMDAGLKVAAYVGMEPEGRFFYISGLDSAAEYRELKGEDIQRLLKSIRDLAEYDEVIIDLSSGFSEIEEVALKEADVIYVPQVEGEAAVAKMRRFLRETEFQETWRVLAEKMKMIVNRTAASEIRSEFSNSGILAQISCVCVVAEAPLFSDMRQIIRSGNMLKSIMVPLMSRETEE